MSGLTSFDLTYLLILTGMNQTFRRILFSSIVVISSGGLLKAGEPWTPQRVAKLRAVSNAQISPDGSQIAYILSVPRDPLATGDEKYEDGPNWAELHVVEIWNQDTEPNARVQRLLQGDDAKRKELLSTDQKAPPRIWDRPYITGEVNVDAMTWMPQGGAVSFLSKRGKDKNVSLYVMPIWGGEARRVLTFKTDIEAYSWSPDGKQVAFIAKEETPKKKKDLKDKGFTAEVIEEDFEFSRVWVAQVNGALASPDGSTAASDAGPRMLKLEGQPSLMKRSPTEDRIALALAPTPLIDDEYMKRKVHVVDAKTGSVMIRFDNPGKLGPISWAPDGKHIAFLSAADINDPSDGRLLVGDVITGDLKDVLPNYEGRAEEHTSELQSR